MTGTTETGSAQVRTYRRQLGGDWWLRRRSYFLYMVRELTELDLP